MKKDELKILRSKSVSELKKSISEAKDRLWNFRNELLSGKAKNAKKLKAEKKLIARLNTFAKEQELNSGKTAK
ncbi:MAG: 50S ribosomal protein L29 [Candidatus Harrisonbacteria bacterium]|nr:50S ribosomal protein L29 [Candidatus Harrisonbacteria bacterium]